MTGLCLVFAVIYEFLGHDVFSWRIRLLFLLPLSMFLLFLFMKPERSEHYLPAITCLRLLVAAGIARNAFIGITEVYGTTSSKITNMTVISAALAFATVVATIVCVITRIIKDFEKTFRRRRSPCAKALMRRLFANASPRLPEARFLLSGNIKFLETALEIL